jgi:hypothetical protein
MDLWHFGYNTKSTKKIQKIQKKIVSKILIFFIVLDDEDGKWRPIDDGVGEREGVEGLGKVFFFNFVIVAQAATIRKTI